MKQIAVISGKGGTGKTSISASFAVLSKNKVMVDCDVDAADLYLLLNPQNIIANPFTSGRTPIIDKNKCIQCGLCTKLCRFNAIRDFSVDGISCEGCGFCYRICPCNAISMVENESGTWMASDSQYGKFIYARLNPGEENSGKLVARIRQESIKIAESDKNELIIIDGPPGTGCPVISSIIGANAVLIVTEPTVSGVHDLERVSQLADHFGIKTYVCVNKWNINEEKLHQIESYCTQTNRDIIGKIVFDHSVSKALNKGITMVQIENSQVSENVRNLWDNLYNRIKEL